MGRIWFLADTHFGIKNDHDVWLKDFTGYFEDVVIPLMRREYREGDILVHLGDVFDNRATVGLNTMCKTIDIFNELSTIFSDIRIVVGNHDIYNKSSNFITSLRCLVGVPNLKIYFEPSVEEFCGKKILFNPWINDIEDERKLLSSVNVDYIFGHFDVNGCQLNMSGVKSSSENGIDVDSFKKSEVYAGHIHKKQDYKNVHYVGSPYQTTRGDRGDTKGITILDVDSGETIFYENTYSPKFTKVAIYEILNKTVGELKEEWENKFVDLTIKGSDVLQCKFDTFIDSLDNCFREFKLITDNTDTIVDSRVVEQDVERKSTMEHIHEWLDDNDVDDDKFNNVIELFNKYKDRL